jgi:hypothetical protein
VKVLITGATGFVGRKLVKKLISNNHQVHVLTRNVPKAALKLSAKVEYFKWSPKEELIPEAAFLGVDAVINLMGENIADGRWSEAHKKRIYDSRILGTENLVSSINKFGINVKTFISTSAIGIYGDRPGEEVVTEDSTVKSVDFLSKVCIDWETAATKDLPENIRSCILRVGIVLGKDGGALQKMLTPFKFGAGGVIGSGKQVMSWVYVGDLVDLYTYALENVDVNGILNATAPRPVTNKIFTNTLGKVLKRPTIFPLPGFVAEIVFGDMSAILLEGQQVIPKKTQDFGFKFQYDTVEKAFRKILE